MIIYFSIMKNFVLTITMIRFILRKMKTKNVLVYTNEWILDEWILDSNLSYKATLIKLITLNEGLHIMIL